MAMKQAIRNATDNYPFLPNGFSFVLSFSHGFHERKNEWKTALTIQSQHSSNLKFIISVVAF